MSEELAEVPKEPILKIDNDKVHIVAKKLADKMNIPIEKADTEIKIGILNAVLLNRHRIQEIKE